MIEQQEFNWEDWLVQSDKKAQKEEELSVRKRQFSEYGKLGGRPKKEEVRTINLTIRLSERERTKMSLTAKKYGLSLSEFLRQVGTGIQPKEVTLEEKEMIDTLLSYHTHFSRISNYLKKAPYSFEMIQEIETIQQEIKNFIYDWRRKHD